MIGGSAGFRMMIALPSPGAAQRLQRARRGDRELVDVRARARAGRPRRDRRDDLRVRAPGRAPTAPRRSAPSPARRTSPGSTSGASRCSSRFTSGTTAGPSAAGVRSMQRMPRAASSGACSHVRVGRRRVERHVTSGCSARNASTPAVGRRDPERRAPGRGPRTSGSTPTTPASSSAGFRMTLYIRSVPMLPEPRIATSECHLSVTDRSEYRDRVDRRPRALLDPQRRDDAEELPPAFLPRTPRPGPRS